MASIKSVEKAFTLLELLATTGESLSLTELSQKMGLNPNTLRSLLNTLVSMNYVEQTSIRGKYTLGNRVVLLAKGLTSRVALQRILDSVLWEIHFESGGEAVFGNMVSGLQLIPLSQIEASHFVTIRSMNFIPAEKIPTTAQGRILLAFLPDDRRRQVLESLHIPKRTPYTLTDVSVLANQLKEIRATNSASNINQNEEGFAAVGSGIFDFDGSLVATISLQAPLIRMGEEKLKQHRESVRKAANQVTKMLNGSLALEKT